MNSSLQAISNSFYNMNFRSKKTNITYTIISVNMSIDSCMCLENDGNSKNEYVDSSSGMVITGRSSHTLSKVLNMLKTGEFVIFN